MPDIKTSDITHRLVGIPPLYLNNFLQRDLGIAASIKPGEAREQRRVFSNDDVFGIALVWRILRKLAGTSKPKANLTARKLLESGTEYIVIIRQPRKPGDDAEPNPGIRTAQKGELAGIVEDNPTANLLFVPIRQKFEDIQKRLDILF
jgi:hypothetical protein